jgi:hypothetical protein
MRYAEKTRAAARIEFQITRSMSGREREIVKRVCGLKANSSLKICLRAVRVRYVFLKKSHEIRIWQATCEPRGQCYFVLRSKRRDKRADREQP